MKKILVITDFDSVGSGYKHICVPLLTELMGLGEYEIKVVGHAYQGEENRHPFSVIPAATIEEANHMAINLIHVWFPDVILVAMDMPIQIRLHAELTPFLNRMPGEESTVPRKYISIAPLENGPLVMDWAMQLFTFDGIFFISQLATDAAHAVGVTKAEHLQVGCDTASMRPTSTEEKKQLRDGLGIPQDAFVVLTVADNQERKNLWAGMDAISRLKNLVTRPIKYILVTREHNPYGMKLRTEANKMGIKDELVIYERGMSTQDLWALYAVSDAYLQPSKAEGLGLPVLDAMCCKVPVVATDTGAMTELLSDERGHLVPGEYEFIDVWGNSRRVMISRERAARELESIVLTNCVHVDSAYEYVSKRTWDIPAMQLHNKIKELTDVT
jgi:glycosyltransferase involved in cell wall biosynthesis